MDTQRIKELIAKREEIDRELVLIVSGGSSQAATTTNRKTASCGLCHEEGHTARTCPQRAADGGVNPTSAAPGV